MRVIYFSYVEVASTGGAPIEARKIYSALQYSKYTFKNFDFRIISLDNNLPESFPNLKLTYSKKDAIMSRVLGHCYYMYWFWKRKRKEIMAYNPNVIILGRSNLGFIVKDIKLRYPDVKIITDVDNIEIDYLEAWTGTKRSLIEKIKLLHLKWCTKQDEMRSVKFSDWCLFLTYRNYQRAKEIYHYTKNSFSILPICIGIPEQPLLLQDKRSVAFYGTLDYEPNHTAIMSFISDVWIPSFASNYNIQLIIAGKNPRKELEDLTKKVHNIKLFSGFKALADILPKETLVVAPLKDGAGMKTKIAEALSYGMLVAGSDEAWIGYEEIDGKSAGIWRANSSYEYKKTINEYISAPATYIRKMGNENRKLYLKYYSLDVSNHHISQLIKKMIEQ